MKSIGIPDNVGPVERIRIKLMLKEKEVLNSDEAAIYLGISKSTLFKLTSTRVLPFSKPNGKLIYFKRSALDEWMLSNSIPSSAEITTRANSHLLTSLNQL